MQGRRYEKKDYFAAMTLVCGVCLFALGDKASLPQFQPKGVVMIVCALFIEEAAAGTFEEKRLFNVSLPASHTEVVMHANIFRTFNDRDWNDFEWRDLADNGVHGYASRGLFPSDDCGEFWVHERNVHFAFHSTIRSDEYGN